MYTDSLLHSHRQKVLADFLVTIPDDKGWWYRLPQLDTKKQLEHLIDIDMYLPHMGALFGLT
jgi:hypothetical protein